MLLVSSLELGGAERQVVQLANHLDPRLYDVLVCSLSDRIPLASALSKRNFRLHVELKRWRFDIGVVRRVAGLMRRHETQLVHAFLFDAEMCARLAARLAGRPIVVSSERNSDYRRPILHALCLRLTSSWFDAMIANSDAGKRFNVRTLGVPPDRIHVVHNGVDVERFRPGDGSVLRNQLGLTPEQPVVGMVANFKPQKNHEMFLRVAERVRARLPDVRFVCAGAALTGEGSGTAAFRSGGRWHTRSADYRSEIACAVRELGMDQCCLFPGHIDDMPAFYNACNATILTSWHEGTPNGVLESMACGVPVVATDVADNATILPNGRVGFLVESNDDGAMATRLIALLTDDPLRARLGCAARDWVSNEFSNASLGRKTSDVYSMLVRQRRQAMVSA